MSAPLVIASQMDAAFNGRLSAHALSPVIIDAPQDEPWRVSDAADILLVRPAPSWSRALDSGIGRPADWPGRVRWVGSASVGIDYYPSWLLDAPIVTCGRGVTSEQIADYVLAAMFLQAKDLEAARVRSPEAWRPMLLGGITGSTVGIIGLGGIGQAVARRALALGARVIASRRRPEPSPIDGLTLVSDLGTLIAQCDHLVLAAPATPATRGLIDATLLSQARPHLHLINVARGSLVDQLALVDALDRGTIGFATLDVTEPEPLPGGHPLWTHPKVRLTPHVSSNWMRVREDLLARIGANLSRFASGAPLEDLVDRVAGY